MPNQPTHSSAVQQVDARLPCDAGSSLSILSSSFPLCVKETLLRRHIILTRIFVIEERTKMTSGENFENDFSLSGRYDISSSMQ